MKRMVSAAVIVLMATLFALPAWAADDSAELVKKLANPIASLPSIKEIYHETF